MYVLGIETSCDETSAAIVKDGTKVISNAVASSLKFHARYGGVIPEIASRLQLETITQVVDSALAEAGIELNDLKLVSVTSGPGLLGSLLVGISFAKSLSLGLDVPLLGINHLESHIYSGFLSHKVQLPVIALVISGGHTALYYVKDFDTITILGATHDDACGEAFDKVAKILGLSYPGGPIIEQRARHGDPKRIKFNCSDTANPLDFSFSGIKTAVLYYVNRRKSQDTWRQVDGDTKTQDKQLVADIAASFQETVIDALIKKALLACKLKKIKRLVVGGGVAANNRLREKFYAAARDSDVRVHFPPPELCMDNAAMVAGLGYQLFKRGGVSDLGLSARLD